MSKADQSLGVTVGLGIGAGLMFFFDPRQGRSRRAFVRDKVTHYVNVSRREVNSTARHWRNKLYGFVAEVKSGFSREVRGRSDEFETRRELTA